MFIAVIDYDNKGLPYHQVLDVIQSRVLFESITSMFTTLMHAKRAWIFGRLLTSASTSQDPSRACSLLQFPSEPSPATWQSSYKRALVFLMHVILVVCQHIPLQDEAKQKAT